MKVILVNGPARSGKDSVGQIIQKHVSEARTAKFAELLKDMVHRAYGLDVEHFYFENVKDEPCYEFFGKTPREVYIAFSEQLIKPLYGDSFFGERLADKLLREPYGTWVVTDSGFRAEAEALVSRLWVQRHPEAQVELWRIHRPGYDFTGDSRSYIGLADLGVDEHEITAANLTELEEQVRLRLGL